MCQSRLPTWHAMARPTFGGGATTKDRMAAVASGLALESDRVLAEQVLAGDELAFRRLYRRHTPRLYLLVLRLLGGSEADAQDAVQETWLKAVEGLGRFQWNAAFGTWLSAIGLNVARETLRRQSRRMEEGLGEQHEQPRRPPLERVETMDLERAIRDLPPGYRAVLVLHDVEGYRHEEIAQRLGIAVGTSKAQLFHARRRIRAALA
jgi:RNA polymerase sigma-70 factor (ECF subfamily)